MTESQLSELLTAAEQAPPEHFDRILLDLRDHPELATISNDNALRAARLLSQSGLYPDLPEAAGLAMRAHRSGVAGAGVLFAELSDKIAAINGQVQPYGTLVVEHQGEMIQPPVDPSVTDEQRHELGLPTLAELTEAATSETRNRARARADDPELPDGVAFARIWRDPQAEQLRSRWEAEGVQAWADGNELTFVTEADGPVLVTPVFPLPTWSAGEGLQVLSLRVQDLDRAVITYTFQSALGGGMSFRRGSHDGRFRGINAPPEVPSNDPVVGSLFDHTIESAFLEGPRTVTVYRPPADQGTDLPVIYATDGNMFAPYARRLDACIEAGTCPPVTVVAAHAAPADHRGNLRALEYLPGFDDRRFDAHQRFFVDELSAWAETELGVPAERDRRVVFGCSDGGGHALATGMLHPERFGHVFGFSTGMPPDGNTRWDPTTHPTVHLCSGTLEDGFHQATQMWGFYLERLGAPHHITARVSGHDLIQWCEELPDAISRAFA